MSEEVLDEKLRSLGRSVDLMRETLKEFIEETKEERKACQAKFQCNKLEIELLKNNKVNRYAGIAAIGSLAVSLGVLAMALIKLYG